MSERAGELILGRRAVRAAAGAEPCGALGTCPRGRAALRLSCRARRVNLPIGAGPPKRGIGADGRRFAIDGPAFLGARPAPHAGLWRRLRPVRAGARRGLVPVRRVGPAGAGFHLRPDERDPRPFASGNRRDRARGGGDAGPPVLLDAVRAGGRVGRGAGRAGAGPAAGDAAVHRRRGERGGDPAGQAGHREVGGGGLRAVLARHDRRARRPRPTRRDGAGSGR